MNAINIRDKYIYFNASNKNLQDLVENSGANKEFAAAKKTSYTHVTIKHPFGIMHVLSQEVMLLKMTQRKMWFHKNNHFDKYDWYTFGSVVFQHLWIEKARSHLSAPCGFWQAATRLLAIWRISSSNRSTCVWIFSKCGSPLSSTTLL